MITLRLRTLILMLIIIRGVALHESSFDYKRPQFTFVN